MGTSSTRPTAPGARKAAPESTANESAVPAEPTAPPVPAETTARRRKRRVTISDIAERAGVTAAAVSLAVNGRPGVSKATRERILAIAKELDWQPSHAARALAGAPVGCVGMVLARPAEVLGNEAFFGGFIAGIQDALSAHDCSLQMKIVKDTDAEIATYRRWTGQRRVDGVVMVDLMEDDPRVPVLEELGRPALVIGGPGHHGSLPSVYVDDAEAMRLIVEHLVALGHRRIAHVAGTTSYLHIAQRRRAFDDLCTAHGVEGLHQEAGFGYAGSQRATEELVALADRPTAIIFDSDEMALAGSRVLTGKGVRIPQDLAIASFEDSALAQLHRPPITAIGRSSVDYGRSAGERILQLVRDRKAPSDGETQVIQPSLIVRGSTDPSLGDAPALD